MERRLRPVELHGGAEAAGEEEFVGVVEAVLVGVGGVGVYRNADGEKCGCEAGDASIENEATDPVHTESPVALGELPLGTWSPGGGLIGAMSKCRASR